MKRIISLILTLCLVLGLAACGGTSPSQSSSAEAPASSSAESTPAGSTEESAPESSGPAETYELIAEQTDLDQIAVSSEHFSFTKGELAYYYAMVYRDNYSYLSYFGVDDSKPLKEQAYSDSMTWFDVLMNEAQKYTTSYLLFCEAANDRGMALTQEDRDYIDSQKAYLTEQAKAVGWDLDTYIEQMFATNIGWDILAKAMGKMLLADRGYEAFVSEQEKQVSEEDIQAELEANPRNYLYVDMIAIDFLYAEGLNDAEKAELTAAFKTAKDRESFKKAVTLFVEKTVEKEAVDEAGSAEAYAEKLMGENTKLKQSYQESELMKWVYSEDRGGDVFVEPEELEGKQYAYLLISEPYRDESTYVNVRHILAQTETYETIEKAHEKAEEILKRWQDGEKTEDSFANLAIELSEDGGSASNGGLYKGVSKGDMIEEFDNWCFDESRKPGDTGIVDTRYGAHVMYFVSSYVGWHEEAMNTLLNELYSKAYQKLSEDHPLTTDSSVVNSINW